MDFLSGTRVNADPSQPLRACSKGPRYNIFDRPPCESEVHTAFKQLSSTRMA